MNTTKKETTKVIYHASLGDVPERPLLPQHIFGSLPTGYCHIETRSVKNNREDIHLLRTRLEKTGFHTESPERLPENNAFENCSFILRVGSESEKQAAQSTWFHDDWIRFRDCVSAIERSSFSSAGAIKPLEHLRDLIDGTDDDGLIRLSTPDGPEILTVSDFIRRLKTGASYWFNTHTLLVHKR